VKVEVTSLDQMPRDRGIRVTIGDHRIAMFRIDDEVFAIGDRCSHAEASIAEGEVWPDECEIECPKHGSAFSLKTGEPLTLPATQPVPTYTVRVDGDDVLVRV
jgi:3-phenylpropionate/trans-cinnamate dioxygenase ferredoxin subunit